MKEVDFGFFFSRVIHFYHISYRETLQLPIKTFWLLSGNIDRINAQQDIRNMHVACAGQSTDEQLQAHRQRLVVETGNIVTMEEASPLDAKRDEAGVALLKTLSNA